MKNSVKETTQNSKVPKTFVPKALIYSGSAVYYVALVYCS